jgi:hypothetical protein
VFLIIPILCFPAVRGSDLNVSLMNWTCVVYGGTMLIVLVWYAIDARKWFKGPKVESAFILIKQQVNIEHRILDPYVAVHTGDLQMESIATKPSSKVDATEGVESSMKDRQLMLEEEMCLLSDS